MSSKTKKSTTNSVQVRTQDSTTRKRSLSTSLSNQENKKKSRSATAKRYKSLLTCTVCDGDAHGYNFDAISCESCKAFFRRNALRPMEKLKCRSVVGQCNVKYNATKRCKRCRLEKCFKSGMRKEWILSDKEREEKQAKIEANRRLRQVESTENNQKSQPSLELDFNIDDFLLSLSPSFLPQPLVPQSYLTDLDWFNIQSIEEGFTEAVKLNQIAGIACYPATQPIQSTLELFRVPLYISAMRLISFIKQVNEFQQLDKSEQLHLVKLNLLTICFFHSIYIYDPRRDAYHQQDTTDPLFSRKDWIRTLNEQFHSDMKQLRNDLIEIFQMDNHIVKLFYIILVFSQQMSLVESVSLVEINSLNIYKAQNVFTDLIYRYCLDQFGPIETPKLFSRYTFKLMKLQQMIDHIKHNISDYMDVTQLSPLAQSLLG